jgi:hypothetical protein
MIGPRYPASLCMLVLLLASTHTRLLAAEPPFFDTSERCLACHNGLTTPSGDDVSIGFDWRASMMANSARDPYWQASVRRETMDHGESSAAIEDECATCHMPMARYRAKTDNRPAQVFAHLGTSANTSASHEALDGVSCSLCHQIGPEHLGTEQSFNGAFHIATPAPGARRPEFGQFEIDSGLKQVMRSSSGGFEPTQAEHIRRSELCATCHTLRTNALGPDGRVVGSLPEQMPYQEWLHSDFANRQSCQACHMPVVAEPVAISRVLAQPREEVSRHVFVAANFFMQRMLNLHRDELSVMALPQELTSAAERTTEYLRSRAAKVTVSEAKVHEGRAEFLVRVENLGGHKLPTAYPSRRAWLHVVVADGSGRKVFESGALKDNGAIDGNDNDVDASRFEPHYREIRTADQVEIYESVLRDSAGRVTTSLLSAVGYLKDNRILPSGFDKGTASPDIAVVGDAAADPAFTEAGHTIRYSIDAGSVHEPLYVNVELMYQPIGFRWAHNLAPYDAPEPRRFVAFFESMQSQTAIALAGDAAQFRD